MINLLPPQEKKSLLLQKQHTMVMILGYIFFVSLACFSLMLLSLYFYMLTQASYYDNALELTKQKYQTKDFLAYKKIIAESNRSLSMLEAFYKKEISFSSALKIMSTLERPDNLYVKNITMTLTKDDTVKMSVLGTCNNRESLLLFKNTIEKEAMMVNAYFPPDNWIKPRDINFYFTVEIKPNTMRYDAEKSK